MVSCAPCIIYRRSLLTAYVPPQSHMEFTIRTMPQDPSRRAQCHLVRGNSLVPPLAHTTHAKTNLSNLANTCSSPQTRNTSSLLPTTAPYAFGTSRRRAVSRRTSATKIQSTALLPASASRAASGSCRAAKIARSTCGTCRAERLCRYLMVTAVSAIFLFAPGDYYLADRPCPC